MQPRKARLGDMHDIPDIRLCLKEEIISSRIVLMTTTSFMLMKINKAHDGKGGGRQSKSGKL